MNEERFKALLEAYGADPRRWPREEREAALHYLDRTPAACAELETARRLDALLDRLPAPAIAADVDALVARATRAAQERPASGARVIQFRHRPVVVWARGLALAAAAVCGFIIGMNNPVPNNGTLDLYDDAQVEDASW